MEQEKDIINKFVYEVLGDRKDLLFNYCLIKNAYTKLKYNEIKKLYPELERYYDEFEIYESRDFFEDQIGDGDRTKIAYAIYVLLWKDKKIKLHYDNNIIKGVLVKDKEVRYDGDTLNTRDTICGLNNQKIYKYINGNLKNYFDLREEAEKFRIIYETLGNFMPLPILTEPSLNVARGPKYVGKSRNLDDKLYDQFDLFLWEVQQFYKNDSFLEFLEDVKKQRLEANSIIDLKKESIDYKDFDNVLKYNIEYFALFNGFDDFVEQNYLNSYIKDGKIKSLFGPKFVEDRVKSKMILPKNYEEFMQYFKNAEEIIFERGKIMQKELFKKMG